ncbi:hypothetical protein AD998_06650 [bacterium 336/3]|nr:hypothetical protein AD998_06650 [bacterium 336/3]
MRYLIVVFCFVFALTVQYFLSILLIKLGYFHNHLHTFGGFLLIMMIYAKLVNFVLDSLKVKLNYQEAIIFKYSILVLLIASFFLNYKMMLP